MIMATCNLKLISLPTNTAGLLCALMQFNNCAFQTCSSSWSRLHDDIYGTSHSDSNISSFDSILTFTFNLTTRYMHKHRKKINKYHFVRTSCIFFPSHHLLSRPNSMLPLIHSSMAHALKVSSLRFDLTRERLQQYKANKRNVHSDCSPSPSTRRKVMWSPLQLGLVPTEVSCCDQIT